MPQDLKVAVAGCLTSMPGQFPLEMAENAGNMIHGRAPFEMFPDAIGIRKHQGRGLDPGSFRKYVNEESSHLIMTIANFLKVDVDDGSRFERFQKYLESFDSELVIFGLGIQAPTADLSNHTLPREAISLMRYLGERCKTVGVRGPLTAEAFKTFADVENTFVTGCPSFFSRRSAFRTLRRNLRQRKLGLRAYSGTQYHREEERQMLATAIRHGAFLVEPVNKFNHQFFLDSLTRRKPEAAPWFYKDLVEASPTKYLSLDCGNITLAITGYFATRTRGTTSTKSAYPLPMERDFT